MQAAKAIICHDTYDKGGWKLEDVKVRKPGEGELLVEIVASGICHTDALVGGIPGGAAPIAFYPRVLGHEGSGYVREVGSGVTVAQVGDPVLLSFAFCKNCELCKAGRPAYCTQFAADNFGGPYNVFAHESEEANISAQFFGQSSFANLSVVRECSIVNAKDLVKDKEELQLFAPLGCGIQTGSGTVINAAQATEKDVVCVIGLGGVGLSAVMGAKVQNCRTIIGIDRVESRIKLAKELGCTHVIDGSKLKEGQKLGDLVREYSEGVGATIVVDTTGVGALINEGIEFTRNRGKFIQVGTPGFDFKLELPLFSWFLTGKSVMGAIEGDSNPPDYGLWPISRNVIMN